jgi:hypothetical protein
MIQFIRFLKRAVIIRLHEREENPEYRQKSTFWKWIYMLHDAYQNYKRQFPEG